MKRSMVLVVSALFVAACGGGSARPARIGCEVRPTAGAPADVASTGEFKGYRVLAGCEGAVKQPRWMGPGSHVVVEGLGKQWARGIPPCPRHDSCEYLSDRISSNGYHTRRTEAVSSMHGGLLQVARGSGSVFGVRDSTACLGTGLYPEILLSDYREVDEVAKRVGEALAAADKRERVGIRVEPRPCALAKTE